MHFFEAIEELRSLRRKYKAMNEKFSGSFNSSSTSAHRIGCIMYDSYHSLVAQFIKLLNYVPFVPRALRAPESRELSYPVPQLSRALHAVLCNLPRALRALVFHVRRTLRAREPHVANALRTLVPHAPSLLHAFHAPCTNPTFCSVVFSYFTCQFSFLFPICDLLLNLLQLKQL